MSGFAPETETHWIINKVGKRDIHDTLRAALSLVTIEIGIDPVAAYVGVGHIPEAPSKRFMPPLVTICLVEQPTTDVDLHFSQKAAFDRIGKERVIGNKDGLYVSFVISASNDIDTRDAEHALSLYAACHFDLMNPSTMYEELEAIQSFACGMLFREMA